MTEMQRPDGSGLSEGLGAWVPAHERVPATGTECVVLVRYTLDRPPFCTVDKWDVQRQDPTGMGGLTIETGEGWNDNFDSDVIAWIAIPPHPAAEWDQRLPAEPRPEVDRMAELRRLGNSAGNMWAHLDSA